MLIHQNPSMCCGVRSRDGSYAVSFHGPQKEMGRLDILFPVRHRHGGLLGKIVQQGDDRLPTVPVIGDLLFEIIQTRSRIILLGGFVHGKEDLSQQRSGTAIRLISTIGKLSSMARFKPALNGV